MPQSVNYLDPLMKVGRQIIGETKKRQKLFCGADQGKRQKLFCGADREKRQEEARMRELLQANGFGGRSYRISIRLNYPVAWRAVCFY